MLYFFNYFQYQLQSFFHPRNEEFFDLIEGCDFIYEVQFYPDGSSKPDHRVSNTIINILKDFFEEKQRVVFYVCESIDKKDKARKRLFDSWFHKNSTDDLDKLDFILKHEDSEWIFSLIIPITHKNYLEIVQYSETIIEKYNDLK